MRYPKGAISISTGQDIPLLRQVLESRHITHDQLFEFMRLGCYELRKNSFNWRVRRLVRYGFLDLQPAGHNVVYSIGASGVSILAVTEDYCPVFQNKHGGQGAASHDHSLELNELHLGLIRQGVLEDWKPEAAIRSRNELTSEGYVKDYDSIVTVQLGGRSASFALEYERTPKKPEKYLRIRRLIEQETRVQRFLYVVPNEDLASFILNCFTGTTAALFVGFAADFARSFHDMKVIDPNSRLSKPIRGAL